MLPLTFLRAHWQLLSFGWVMSFCSGFGQTYFISLFGGEIRSELGLSHSAYGTCYSIGTLASACLLLWAGRLIDSRSLTAFSVGTIGGLAVATAAMAGIGGVVSFTLACLGLRLFGQGLMTHAAMTAMGRYFSAERGRAVSFAALGHSTAEAALPLTVVALMTLAPWRSIWLMGGGFLLLCTVPAVVSLLRGAAASHGGKGGGLASSAASAGTSGPTTAASAGRDLALSEALHDRGLYLRLPVLLAPAFVATGLIFHQVHIAEQKGWSLTLVASSLSVFAAGSLAMMIAAGPLIDRFSARRLVPLCLAPLVLSCLTLAATDAAAGAVAFFGLLGAGTGLVAIILGAIWAELYGTTHLGAIRSFGTSALVFSTGLAPILMGFLMDWGWSVETIAAGCAIYSLAASAVSATAAPLPARRPSV